jgi:hypothetical protein
MSNANYNPEMTFTLRNFANPQCNIGTSNIFLYVMIVQSDNEMVKRTIKYKLTQNLTPIPLLTPIYLRLISKS